MPSARLKPYRASQRRHLSEAGVCLVKTGDFKGLSWEYMGMMGLCLVGRNQIGCLFVI